MGLVLKVFTIAVIVIAIIAVVSFVVRSAPKPITQAQAVSNVTRFIQKSAPPGTLINITSVTPSQYAGSWHIVAGVIINSTKPCPSYYVESFDYPQYQFVSGLDNNYTANCIVNGLNSSYVIGYYPIAVAVSYAVNNSQVRGFVKQYGYGNVFTQASRVASQTIGGINYTNVWVVYYTSPQTTNSLQVYLQQNGKLITVT